MTLGSHQQTVGKSQDHLTPRWIIDTLGPFDLDPCASLHGPPCAIHVIRPPADGLAACWPPEMLIWLNPPFDRYRVGKWIQRLADHGNGIALLHARTETAWFRPCWKHASAILFMAKRIAFCRADGTAQSANSGAPPVLIAFGDLAKHRLASSGILGALIHDWDWITAGAPDSKSPMISISLR